MVSTSTDKKRRSTRARLPDIPGLVRVITRWNADRSYILTTGH
ncbi:MAG TPA: hypothetical protein VK880_00105 [Anaerolineales bacterium]|nr:hypothetical protein [Anaerolineales bacterium]